MPPDKSLPDQPGRPASLIENALEIPDWAQIFADPKDLLNPAKYREAVGKACPIIKASLTGLILPKEDRLAVQEIVHGGSLAAAIGAPPLVPPDQIALEWLVQKMLFNYLKKHFHLKEVNHFPETRHRACITLSRTASIIIVGNRQKDGKRRISPVQIPSRQATWGRQIVMGDPIPGVHNPEEEGLAFAGYMSTGQPEVPTEFLQRIRDVQVGWGLMSVTSYNQFCGVVDRILVLPDDHKHNNNKPKKSRVVTDIKRILVEGLKKLGLWRA